MVEVEPLILATAASVTPVTKIEMASLRGESSNHLLEILEEWNDYLERPRARIARNRDHNI
jgi:hypothetical protein